ncbi:site-specific DNA-methyltransferase [Candidatus Omnitrophota bacterium]
MEKLKMHSPNLTEGNIAKLAVLFPDCVTESTDENGELKKTIDFDQLHQELSGTIVEGPQERYHLNWPGKREALHAANAPIAKTLRPCREESVDFDTTQNLFIEGDNLDALKLLQETYLGKVKMIYIDPPYNTGKDFIYSDNFSESIKDYLLESGQKDEEGNRLIANTDSNGRFHSDWLSMLYPRLKLAQDSIDDNEQTNLKKLCEDIFGEKNFVGQLILQTATDNNLTQINTEHEYILCFAKNKDFQDYWTRRSEAAMLIQNEYERLKKKYGSDIELIQVELRKWIKNNSANLPKVTHYDNVDEKGVFHDGDIANTKFGGYEYEVLHPKTGRQCKIPEKGFRFPQTTLNKMILDNDVMFGQDETTLIKPKKRLENVKDALRSIIYEDGRASTKIVEFLLARDVFKNPKSHTILSRIIEFVTKDNDIILDFFAGSASTAHAVLELNAELGSNRKIILVQINEKVDESDKNSKQCYKFLIENNLRPYISEVSKERIRRAGKKIKDELTANDKNNEEDLFSDGRGSQDLDIGFRVLKIDSSNMADVYYKPDEVEQDLLASLTDNIKDDRTAEDLLFQVLLDWGVDLSLPIAKETIAGKEVFFVDGNALAACFAKDGGITEDFVKELAKREPLRVVFRDFGYKDDSVKINVEQIFKIMSPHTDVKTI